MTSNIFSRKFFNKISQINQVDQLMKENGILEYLILIAIKNMKQLELIYVSNSDVNTEPGYVYEENAKTEVIQAISSSSVAMHPLERQTLLNRSGNIYALINVSTVALLSLKNGGKSFLGVYFMTCSVLANYPSVKKYWDGVFEKTREIQFAINKSRGFEKLVVNGVLLLTIYLGIMVMPAGFALSQGALTWLYDSPVTRTIEYILGITVAIYFLTSRMLSNFFILSDLLAHGPANIYRLYFGKDHLTYLYIRDLNLYWNYIISSTIDANNINDFLHKTKLKLNIVKSDIEIILKVYVYMLFSIILKYFFIGVMVYSVYDIFNIKSEEGIQKFSRLVSGHNIKNTQLLQILVKSGALSHMIGYAGAAYKLINISPKFFKQLMFNYKNLAGNFDKYKFIFTSIAAFIILAGSGASMQEIAKENDIKIFENHFLALVFVYICAVCFNINGLFLYFSDRLSKELHDELLNEVLTSGRSSIESSLVSIRKTGQIATNRSSSNHTYDNPAYVKSSLFQERSPVMIKAVLRDISIYAYQKTFWRILDDLNLKLTEFEQNEMKIFLANANKLHTENDSDNLKALFNDSLGIDLAENVEIDSLLPVDLSSDDSIYNFFLSVSNVVAEYHDGGSNENLLAYSAGLDKDSMTCLDVNRLSVSNISRTLMARL